MSDSKQTLADPRDSTWGALSAVSLTAIKQAVHDALLPYHCT